jgi:hypothetical protein
VKKPVKKSKTKAAPPLAEDQKLAGQLRAAMIEALGPVCLILDKADAAGLVMAFNLDRNNPTGLNRPVFVQINRNL